MMNNESLLSFDEEYKETGVVRLDSDGNLGVFSYYGLTARNINYCPVCGRSLEDEEK
ncbi:TPA: hypothetical protein PNM72_001009 [Listeria monocytogenes]|nr:hypothetical protein [Listeria monocytogenes]EDN7582248.1 hypothetical protein [Listeria monocytogenes]EDN7596956.1 hypothetical protein [Listeria monocytogenes]EDN7600106.1 hypothetical protein [Listeria monocytogenes]EDN8019282.1 hypothetical protein [Listeria monocytogenes]EDN8037007.1 hypothetical protein [Listeria monocytogenes]